jgi:hypothetical protein
VVFVRVVLSLIGAALTFVPAYTKIAESSTHVLTGYFLAFQCGFFWQAAFDAVVKQNASPGTRRGPRLVKTT